MNPLALAVIGQLRAISETVAKEYWRSPAMVIITGTVPYLRAHLYFRSADVVTPAKLRAANEALIKCLGSDTVQDPARIMRLAGTVSYPTPAKQARGYITELVSLQHKRDARAFSSDELIALSGRSTRFGDYFDFESKTGRDDSELTALLDDASRTPGKWHNAIRDATATMIGRGWSDTAIKLSCAPYCRGGANDPDLVPLIAGARARWDKPNDEQTGQREGKSEPRKLRIIDPIVWQDQPVPPREWVVQDRIPARTVSLLMGDGAAGKTTLALQLTVARALGLDWIGSIPNAGRTLFLSAEDDADELHRRIDAIRQHYGVAFSNLTDFRLVDLVGEDAVLGELQRNGTIKATLLFDAISEEVKSFGPDLVIVDALADAFAGDENNRTQARQFVGLLKGLARKHRAAFLCLAHPSLYGMNSGSGSSGSTGWSNSVRSRLYFENAKASDGAEPDPDLRQLSLKKTNYGPVGQPVTVRWKAGVYVPEGGMSSLDRLALAAKAQETFLTLLRMFEEQGQVAGPTKSANYAPTVFSRHPKGAGISSQIFAVAMQELSGQATDQDRNVRASLAGAKKTGLWWHMTSLSQPLPTAYQPPTNQPSHTPPYTPRRLVTALLVGRAVQPGGSTSRNPASTYAST
jgi:RecA-family ATPase